LVAKGQSAGSFIGTLKAVATALDTAEPWPPRGQAAPSAGRFHQAAISDERLQRIGRV